MEVVFCNNVVPSASKIQENPPLIAFHFFGDCGGIEAAAL